MKNLYLFLFLAISSLQVLAQGVIVNEATSFAGSGTTVGVTIPATSAGHTNIITSLSGAQITSVTDDKSNTYAPATNARAAGEGGAFSDIWSCHPCTAGVTAVTLHWTGSNVAVVNAYEIDGITGILDIANHADNITVDGSGHGTGPSVTTSTTDFIIATGDADNGFDDISSPFSFSTNGSSDGYIFNAAPGSYQPVFTGSVSGDSGLISVGCFTLTSAVAPPSNLGALGVGD